MFTKDQVNSFDPIIFGPHVTISKAEDELLNILLEKGKEVRNPEFDFTNSLAGKMKEQYNFKNYKEWFKPLFKTHVEDYINTLPNSHSRHIIENSLNHAWSVSNMWINYQGPKEYNPPHTHQGDISFIIYVDIPKEIYDERVNCLDPLQALKTRRTPPGNLVFEYGESVMSNFLSFVNTSYQISPETGIILMFPSWLKHHVFAFESNVKRVSVSGNIYLNFEKPKLENDDSDIFRQEYADDGY
jgi:hypothetical protein